MRLNLPPPPLPPSLPPSPPILSPVLFSDGIGIGFSILNNEPYQIAKNLTNTSAFDGINMVPLAIHRDFVLFSSKMVDLEDLCIVEGKVRISKHFQSLAVVSSISCSPNNRSKKGYSDRYHILSVYYFIMQGFFHPSARMGPPRGHHLLGLWW